MRVSFHSQPAYTLATCYLDYGETMRAESGAMATMSDSIAVSADAGPGGVVKGLLRKQLGGESFFMGKYTAHTQDAWVSVAPKKPGDIIAVDLSSNGPGLVAEAGSFLAMSEGINVDVKWGGVRNIVMREGATLLHIDGDGVVLLCTYGGFVRHHLPDGAKMIVDTGHMVAYEDTCHVKVGMLGGATTAAFSGEGLVAQVTGPGYVYVQTRAETELRNWILPEKNQNG